MSCKVYFCLLLFLSASNNLMAMEKSDPFVLVRAGDIERLALLITGSQDVMSFYDSNGNTLLHCTQSPEVATFLLTRKAHINACNAQKNTPLHKALWEGSPDDFTLAQILLDHGADITLLNNNKQNPAHLVVSKHPEFVHRLLTHVPRYAIEEILYPQHRIMEFQLLCCFNRLKRSSVLEVPKDIQRMLVRYCTLPPYRFQDEPEMLNRLLFAKLDAVKIALEARDHLESTPAFLELRYWPHDRSKLLDPLRIDQYVPDIIASIGRLVELTLTYTHENQHLTIHHLPSIE